MVIRTPPNPALTKGRAVSFSPEKWQRKLQEAEEGGREEGVVLECKGILNRKKSGRLVPINGFPCQPR